MCCRCQINFCPNVTFWNGHKSARVFKIVLFLVIIQSLLTQGHVKRALTNLSGPFPSMAVSTEGWGLAPTSDVILWKNNWKNYLKCKVALNFFESLAPPSKMVARCDHLVTVYRTLWQARRYPWWWLRVTAAQRVIIGWLCHHPAITSVFRYD